MFLLSIWHILDTLQLIYHADKKCQYRLKVAKDAKKAMQISDDLPEKLIGYFPVKNINDKLYWQAISTHTLTTSR
ncbi:hypothetical protein D7X98_09855 [bacterium 1XD8-76]|nr:hypothetical protein D7X98_09855 [bacterium 1XD8-76]